MRYDDRDDELDKEIAKLNDDASEMPVLKCSVCGSEKIIPTAVLGGNERPVVMVASDPTAMIFKGWEHEELTVRVCGACGHTQFFAKNPHRLYSVYLQSLRVERADGQT